MKAHCVAGRLQEEKNRLVKMQQQQKRSKKNAINLQLIVCMYHTISRGLRKAKTAPPCLSRDPGDHAL